MQTSGRGGLLNKRFGLLNPPTLVATLPSDRPITFSHLRVDTAGQVLANIPAEDAYSIHLHLRETTSFDVREEGRANRKEFTKAGTLCFFDLQSPPRIVFDTPFHTIRSYMPFPALQEFAEDAGTRRQVFLKPPPCGTDDPIVRNLLGCLHPIFEHPEQGNALFVDYIALALQAHLLHKYATTVVQPRPVRGGLAPWQTSRVREMMRANLGGDISITALARDCGLSSSHFARAFKKTTGLPPHRWLLERRIEAAQDLLLDSEKSLPEIATACGFSDQSHLTRAFTKIVGTSPGYWRRERRD